jgi:hypothetical protein
MTPEEQLAYERQTAAIVEIRSPRKEKASRLETWLGSSVLAALIGVVGTGMFGVWLSGLIQDRAKNNELQRTADQQKLTDQNAVVIRILGLVAAQSSAIDDLLTTVNNSYADDRFRGAELGKLTGWKENIRIAHDTADSNWRREQITAGYTLLYVFDGNVEVVAAWTALTTAADAFETCANTFYGQAAVPGTDLRPDEICEPERKGVHAALGRFTTATSGQRVRSTRTPR